MILGLIVGLLCGTLLGAGIMSALAMAHDCDEQMKASMRERHEEFSDALVHSARAGR